MKRWLALAALACLGSAPLPALAHKDVSVRIAIGTPLVVYRTPPPRYHAHPYGHHPYGHPPAYDHYGQPVVVYRYDDRRHRHRHPYRDHRHGRYCRH